jgi:hypothetical protein
MKKGKNKKNFVQVEQKFDEKFDVFIANFKSQAFNVLLSDGFLIPTKKQLTATGIIAEGKKL